MTDQYQAIIYDQATGTILQVLYNTYIKSKFHLRQLCKRKTADGIGFIYFPHDLEINPDTHSIRRLSYNYPPSVVSKSGIPLDFELIMSDRRLALTSGKRCLVEFEGGMGDQLMEAAAVLDAMETYPKCEFAIRAENQYLNILRHVDGLPQVQAAYISHTRDYFNYIVSNHTNYISDPRGGIFGKASLYGAWLGLDRVNRVARLIITDADYAGDPEFMSRIPGSKTIKNFLIQFRSGSGHGKSWHAEKVVRLAELLHEAYNCNVYVVGRSREIQPGQPHIVDLTGQTTWWQNCLLLSKMDCCICIDSGIMHMARSLGIPYVCMWGGTNAQTILGEPEAEFDIRLPLDCYDQICYDCPRGTNDCMTKITPDMVLEHINKLFKSRSKKCTSKNRAKTTN